MKYKFDFYHPSFVDMENEPSFEFETKEEILDNEEIKRICNLDYHIRLEQITDDGKNYIGLDLDRSVLMHICKDENGESFWVKGFIKPHLEEQFFPEWIYENYPRKPK